MGSNQSKVVASTTVHSTPKTPVTRTGTERYGSSGYTVKYIGPSGIEVSVQSPFDPHRILGVDKGASIWILKKAFLQKLKVAKRSDRVTASLSYYALTSKSNMFRKNSDLYEIADADIFLFATVGDTQKLMAAIMRDKDLLVLNNEHRHTVLYLAARSGYHDTTMTLLKEGALVNCQQVDGSTPLHGASFYGQKEIVEMLLEYGADPRIKNRFGSTPVDEADNESIKEVFQKYHNDNLIAVTSPMVTNGNVFRIEPIQHKGQLIAKQVHRNIDDDTWTKIRKWKVGWHGTKTEHLPSIFKYGLKPSGTELENGKSIKPPRGHIPLDCRYGDVDNWSRAVFVSPSLLYASHGVYAEEVMSENKRWRVIVMARVMPGCFTTHAPTLAKSYSFCKDEPQDSEYRIFDSEPQVAVSECSIPLRSTEQKDLILRVESSSNVVVTSVVFVLASFLEEFNDTEVNYEELEKLFCGT